MEEQSIYAAEDPNQCARCGDTKDVEPGRYCKFCKARYMSAWLAYGFRGHKGSIAASSVVIVGFIAFGHYILAAGATALFMSWGFRIKDRLKRTMVWSRKFGGEDYFR